MCGICGFFSKNPYTEDALTAMNNTMYTQGTGRRGGRALILPKEAIGGLAQRRLPFSTFALGHQPMHSPDGRVSVVYNGEIYHFKES